MSANKPIRKKFKDFLNGTGAVAATSGGIATIAAFNGAQNTGGVIGWSIFIAAICFSIAGSIKPRMIRKRKIDVTGQEYLEPEWK